MVISSQSPIYLGLDMGEQRIGVAFAEATLPIAVPLVTIQVDATEKEQLMGLCEDRKVTDIVIGRPRNQSGELTAQTSRAEAQVMAIFAGTGLVIHYQDESLTSVMAEDHLIASKRPYEKKDIDMRAAAIILQDYLDSHRVGQVG